MASRPRAAARSGGFEERGGVAVGAQAEKAQTHGHSRAQKLLQALLVGLRRRLERQFRLHAQHLRSGQGERVEQRL